MEPESSSPYPQEPATRPYPEPTPSSSNMSLFRLRLRDTSSRNTPPGDPRGGVVYLRIVLSPEEASHFMGNS